MCCPSSLWGIKCFPCNSAGRGVWKLVPGSLQTSPHAPFPLADFALYPFPVINRSHAYNYMLCPMRPSSKSPNHGMVLRALAPTLGRHHSIPNCLHPLLTSSLKPIILPGAVSSVKATVKVHSPKCTPTLSSLKT